MPKVVIIGAGLTGLSTAYYLEQAGFFDYVILEKEREIGGLCRSLYQDGFTFDYTGHLLHLSDLSVRSTIEAVFAPDNFLQVARKSSIFSHNTYTDYPFQINLRGLPPRVIIDCIEGFVQRPSSPEPPQMFREWVLASFGEGLGKHFFFPYQAKIFDIDIDTLTSSWTGRFVPATSLKEMLVGAFEAPERSVGYNAHFLYPKAGGIIRWVAALAATLYNPILLEHAVQTIDTTDKVVICKNGAEQPFDHLISTIPLDQLVGQLRGKDSHEFAAARPYLRCNSVINYNMGLKKPPIAPAHWIYYPELQYPFYRVGVPTNLTAHMAPEGCSSISGEASALYCTDEEIAARSNKMRASMMKLFAICESEIATEALLYIPHAYVIFDRWRDTHLPALLSGLQEQYSIKSTGRYGGWKYASMQEAVIDGKEAAQAILQAA